MLKNFLSVTILLLGMPVPSWGKPSKSCHSQLSALLKNTPIQTGNMGHLTSDFSKTMESIGITSSHLKQRIDAFANQYPNDFESFSKNILNKFHPIIEINPTYRASQSTSSVLNTAVNLMESLAKDPSNTLAKKGNIDEDVLNALMTRLSLAPSLSTKEQMDLKKMVQGILQSSESGDIKKGIQHYFNGDEKRKLQFISKCQRG